MINGRVNKNEFIDLVKETFLLNDMRHITEADILRTVEHPENPLRAAGHVDNLYEKMSNGEWISSERTAIPPAVLDFSTSTSTSVSTSGTGAGSGLLKLMLIPMPMPINDNACCN